MIKDKILEKIFSDEYYGSANIIWQNDDGIYEVFHQYQIVPENYGYRVFSFTTEIGVFSNKKTALSWCIADKYKKYNLAIEIMNLDNKLSFLTSDIQLRSSIAKKSKNIKLQNIVDAKLVNKIINKNQIEHRLTKCINWTKYYQQKGFKNEII